MSHLTGTVEYPDCLIIYFVVFYINVDSAFHSALLCLARLPSLDAAPQTVAGRGVRNIYKIVCKPVT